MACGVGSVIKAQHRKFNAEQWMTIEEAETLGFNRHTIKNWWTKIDCPGLGYKMRSLLRRIGTVGAVRLLVSRADIEKLLGVPMFSGTHIDESNRIWLSDDESLKLFKFTTDQLNEWRVLCRYLDHPLRAIKPCVRVGHSHFRPRWVYLKADLESIQSRAYVAKQGALPLATAAKLCGYSRGYFGTYLHKPHPALGRPIRWEHDFRPFVRPKNPSRKSHKVAMRHVVVNIEDVETIAAQKLASADPGYLSAEEVANAFPGGMFHAVNLSRWAQWCVHLDGQLRRKWVVQQTRVGMKKVPKYFREDLDAIAKAITGVAIKHRRFVGLATNDDVGQWGTIGDVSRKLGIPTWKPPYLRKKRFPRSASLPEGRVRVKRIPRPSSDGPSRRTVWVYHLGDVQYLNSLPDGRSRAPSGRYCKAEGGGPSKLLVAPPSSDPASQTNDSTPTKPTKFNHFSAPARNKLFLEWYEDKSLVTYRSPACIRDIWNEMFPQAKIGIAASGIGIVKTGMRRARRGPPAGVHA